MAQYMATLHKLTERCEFKDYLEKALHDRLACGLQNEAVQRRLFTNYVKQDTNTIVRESQDVDVPGVETEALFTFRERDPDSAIVLKPVVNGVTLQMELDTSASVSLMYGENPSQSQSWSRLMYF